MRISFDSVIAEVISADINAVLSQITKKGISLENVEYIDDLTIRFLINRGALNWIKSDCKHIQKIRIVKQTGIFKKLKEMGKHPVLMVTVLFIFALTAYLPTRVLFFQVSGNDKLPEKYILEKIQEYGIGFGSSRRAVRSEEVKNVLLEKIPELDWAAITTNGCTATIHIKESTKERIETDTKKVGSIIALRDGIIDEITVTNGTALCKVGDAVTKGQKLISGYTDCGIYIQATDAQGEIYAHTERDVQVVALKETQKRGNELKSQIRYSLLIGKKLVKFYKDSRISDGECVKIKSISYVQLPGDHTLPIAFIKEELSYNLMEKANTSFQASWLKDKAAGYIMQQMSGGSIHQQSTVEGNLPGLYYLNGSYSCREIIGLNISEEIIQSDAKSH